MPQTISVKSQTPEHLIVSLSWKKVLPTPPADEFIRLEEGGKYSIPKGHATAIRATEGWHYGYAYEDIEITGPVDFSPPKPMTRREFSPIPDPETDAGKISGAVTGGAIFTSAIATNLWMMDADIETIDVVGINLGLILLWILMVWAAMRLTSSISERTGAHSCKAPEEKAFWREDLKAAQAQVIRKPSFS